jgi:hypothetical protein
MTFDYVWTLLAVYVEQLILGHAYDEYLVCHKKTRYGKGETLAYP